MKHTETKRIDLAAQIAAFVIPVFGVPFWGIGSLFFAYFTVGAVQLLSCIISRWALSEPIRSAGRKYYEILLSIVCAVTLASCTLASILDGDFLFALAMGMLFLGPVMAVWYGVITWQELENARTADAADLDDVGQWDMVGNNESMDN